MSGTNFTPGPWRFEISAGWGRTIRAMKDKYIAWNLKNDHDAHLIAAAPDLYEALKDMRSVCMSLLAGIPVRDCDEVYTKSDNALAKAEGKSPQ
jgi:hypothetical protein